jgi:hypothetical protein
MKRLENGGQFIVKPLQYLLEPLCKVEEFVLYRGEHSKLGGFTVCSPVGSSHYRAGGYNPHKREEVNWSVRGHSTLQVHELLRILRSIATSRWKLDIIIHLTRFCTALLLLFPFSLPGQRVTSDLLGHITDPSGAPVSMANVSATNENTGLERVVQSDIEGLYRFAGLAPGKYAVSVDHENFRKTTVRNIELQVSQHAILDLKLEIGPAREVVDVREQTELVERQNAELSNVVTGSTLRELPLNGRDLFQLTLLETGVIPTGGSGNPFAEGATSKAAVNGARPTMNNINLDGSDINDPAYNTPPGGVTGVQLGVEAIQEFRVLLHNYGAEFGRNAGANVQLVTKSGTNQFHGSLFEFHRNAAFDARNFFDQGPVPPFARNQFGATLGGPIRKNRVFFFTNYESLRESRSITASLTVPDLNARSGRLPSASNSSTLVSVGVNPLITPFLAQYPLPNAGVLGNGVGLYRTSARQPARDDYGLIRADYELSQKDSVFWRYVADDSEAVVPFMSTLVPGFPGDRHIRNQYLQASWQRIFGPNLFNELKLNFNRVRLAADPVQGSESISLVPGVRQGQISIDGLPALGNNIPLPLGAASKTYEVIENASYEWRGHDFKAGGNFKRLQINSRQDAFVSGAYTFSDLSPFGFPVASSNPPLEAFLEGLPFLYVGVDPSLSDSERGHRQNYLAFYGQDNWRIHPRLVLNIGLRWEYWSNPTEVNGRLSNIRDLRTDTHPTPGSLWDRVPLDLWSPRFGLAWVPHASGKTVIRAGFGLVRDQLWANIYLNTRHYEPYFRALLYVLPQFRPSPPNIDSLIGLGGPPSPIGVFGITYHPDFPYLLHHSLSVQRQLGRDFVLQLAYVGARGNHLVRSGEANPNEPALGRRLNPNFGSVPEVVTDAQSFYNSGQVSLQKRTSGGLQFQGSYTWSKLVDDLSGPFPTDSTSDTGVGQDFFNRKGDRGRSSFDRRHVFVFNALWDLPWRVPGSKFSRAVSENWSLGGILSLLSGPPFSATLGAFNNSGNLASFPADRPNLRASAVPCAATLGRPEQWFNPTIFTLPPAGSFGNAGRNILCGPGLANVDFSVRKQIPVSERVSLQFRAEAFNVLNHANFDVPVNTPGPNGNGGIGDAVFLGRRANCQPAIDPMGCGVPAADAGRIARTSTPSRQLQFALKLTF